MCFPVWLSCCVGGDARQERVLLPDGAYDAIRVFVEDDMGREINIIGAHRGVSICHCRHSYRGMRVKALHPLYLGLWDQGLCDHLPEYRVFPPFAPSFLLRISNRFGIFHAVGTRPGRVLTAAIEALPLVLYSLFRMSSGG